MSTLTSDAPVADRRDDAASRTTPPLHALNRAQKLHVMQFLVSELAQQEGESVASGLAYPVWSPHDAFDAASSMLRVLKADEYA